MNSNLSSTKYVRGVNQIKLRKPDWSHLTSCYYGFLSVWMVVTAFSQLVKMTVLSIFAQSSVHWQPFIWRMVEAAYANPPFTAILTEETCRKML